MSYDRDFPGRPEIKNPPSNIGIMGSIPDQETNIPHITGQLRLGAAAAEAHEPQDPAQPKKKKKPLW